MRTVSKCFKTVLTFTMTVSTLINGQISSAGQEVDPKVVIDGVNGGGSTGQFVDFGFGDHGFDAIDWSSNSTSFDLFESNVTTDLTNTGNAFMPPDVQAWVELDVTLGEFSVGQANSLVIDDTIDWFEKASFTPKLDPAQLKTAVSNMLATKEGRGTMIMTTLTLMAVVIEQKLLTPEQAKALIVDTYFQIGKLLDPYNSTTDDLDYMSRVGSSFAATQVALEDYANNGYKGVLNIPVLGISAGPGGIMSIVDDGIKALVTFDLGAGKINVLQADGVKLSYPLSGPGSPASGFSTVAGNDVPLFLTPNFGSAEIHAIQTAAQQWGQPDPAQTFELIHGTASWNTAVGADVVAQAIAMDPATASKIAEGTAVWNSLFGTEKVTDAIKQNPATASSIAQGTAAAVQIYGKDSVDAFIMHNPDLAAKGAQAIQAAKSAGYSDAQISAYISANPNTWYNWNP